MRRTLAAVAAATALSAVAAPAHAEPRITVTYEDGCYYLASEAFRFQVVCL